MNVASPPPPSMLDEAIRLMQQGRANDAYRVLASMAESEPSSIVYWHLAGALHASRMFAASALAFDKCVQADPNEPNGLLYKGWNLHLSNRTDEAVECLNRSLAINPNNYLAHANMAGCLLTLGKIDESLMAARRAYDLAPAEPLSQMSLAFAMINSGKLLEGFRLYEARFKFKIQDMMGYPYARWDGRHVPTLFIQSEQGIGDTIQMLRFMPEVCKYADNVIFYITKELNRVCARMFAGTNVELRAMPAPIPRADVWSPLMSVIVPLGIDRKDLLERYSAPYLTPVGTSFHKDGAFKIGIAWAGNPGQEADSWRSASIMDFVPLAEVPGVQLYSIQVGERQKDIGSNGLMGLVHDLSPAILDIDDTLREIAGLDLVITVDTAPAHIAGAMGKETWVVVNNWSADWRYGKHGDTSDWYASQRIFRRCVDEESWRAVFKRVKTALEERVAK